MAKSQYEKDQARRGRAESRKRTAGDGRPAPWKDRRVMLGAAAVAVVGLLVWAVVANSGVPTDRAGNLASFGVADDPFMGDPDAPVVLVGYESLSCEACHGFHTRILPDLKADFFDTGEVVYYFLAAPLNPDVDFRTAMAQECAIRELGVQGFWNFTDAAYGRFPLTAGAARTLLRDVALGMGEDPAPVEKCFDDEATRRAVSADWESARDHDVRGTPNFFVFGTEGEALHVTNYGNLAGILRDAVLRE